MKTLNKGDLQADFIFNYKKAILLALVERKLLTYKEYEKCVEALK